MIKDLDSYLKDIDEMSKSSLNEDQKQLIKKILEKTDPQDLDNVFQLLIQRVKIGFSFDVAPSVHQTKISILAKNEQLSFMNDAHNLFKNDTNSLIIGENYDVLKNLLVLERERERLVGATLTMMWSISILLIILKQARLMAIILAKKMM